MLEVIGMGDDGWAGLPSVVRQRVLGASVVIGAPRHLASLPDVPSQKRHRWPSPLVAGLPTVLAEVSAADAPAGTVVALASGDPLMSGVASTLIRHLGQDTVRVTPAISSETLARARMGWDAAETTVITTVGRDLDRVRPHLTPHARLVVLCSDGHAPAELARLLMAEGCSRSRLTAFAHLGGPEESRRASTADEWGDAATPDLVLVAVEVTAAAASRSGVGPAPGRPETAFDHDGQITKRDVRASALARLRPIPGGLLWDLGAGSGAVGIEWALATPGARVVAVERRADRAARIRANASRFGVAGQLSVVEAEVHEAIRDLEPPAAVFVGGGLNSTLIEDVWSRLPDGSRFVAHAVTLTTEQALVEAASRYGGDLTRITVEQALPLGPSLSWTPARAVVQWAAQKETP